MDSTSSSSRFPSLSVHHSDLTLTLSPPPISTPSPRSPPIPSSSARHHHHHHHHKIRLTELLLTCAAHVASGNLPRAESCLRLISSLSSDPSDSSHRLASALAAALAARLLRRRYAGLLSALRHPLAAPPSRYRPPAFSRALPFLPAALAVAGCTVLRALAPDPRVHLLDLGPSPALWPPLLNALSHLPSRRLRLTALGCPPIPDKQFPNVDFSRIASLDLNSVQVLPGESMVVVAMLTLHELLAEEDNEDNNEEDEAGTGCHRRAKRFLSELRAMSPKVVVVVEQEADHNSGRMVERFGEALHYYGAVFESVEAAAEEGLMTGEERAEVEEAVGRELENVVACEGEERVERHERMERWGERMRKAGFRQAKVWYDAVEEAKRVVGSWSGKGSYGVVVDRGCLMICWKDRRSMPSRSGSPKCHSVVILILVL